MKFSVVKRSTLACLLCRTELGRCFLSTSRNGVGRRGRSETAPLFLQPYSGGDGENSIDLQNINSEGQENSPDESLPVVTPPTKRKRKKELIICDRESCETSLLREKLGSDNEFEFDGPATGQVCYVWNEELNERQLPPSVLFLVKRGGDDEKELVSVVANAVKELTKDKIKVLLAPDLAAKLKFKFGIDDSCSIELFEPGPYPGFGGNHVELTDSVMGSKAQKSIQINQPQPDLICTVGGDGLLLHASMLFPGPVPPILCVAGGSLGFLTPFSRDEMTDAIRVSLGTVQNKEEGDKWRQDRHFPDQQHDDIRPLQSMMQESLRSPSLGFGGRIHVSLRMRLDCRVINREGVVRARFNVLNDVVIDRGSSPYLAALECYCDNEHFTTIQADGLIVSTPTGSTAYSMSVGASIVHPAVNCVLMSAICPHVLSYRPTIFPDHVVLRCYVPDDARAEASVAFDGRYRRTLRRGDSVQVQMSRHPVPTINHSGHSGDWLSSLKRSFNFNTRARQRPL
uniref:NAD(+) kinase n=1 Tax=Grammatophora oceanica TaxID=210454 RepID=A0A7S1YFA0_9STRA|mmetsp:Transcript_44021/g.65283  ORF Transcript_44021/g.65283 Transcript_44021/m.65283 type:complete len:513 (+) Transcript_44021:162-1700(+)|eukprot:CAMPEP_0194035494 /NCGR_PEP_ID=MMETSP0009_2-20130614/7920_1 /TAXON_ID=210454 /ORGANISM="Grammatophora oceanica, Strain CCMP 410" /LENGTH=512 /DNA_ID=CAMNT_0038676877 /DNA_START=88 /DNA_END=1626 /DNA_ORIENTATION=-